MNLIILKIKTQVVYQQGSGAGDAQSCGYGFVHFETEDAAKRAIEKVNGMMLNEKKVGFLQIFLNGFLNITWVFYGIYTDNLVYKVSKYELQVGFQVIKSSIEFF